MQQAELIIQSGAHAGQHIPIIGSKLIIGRERDCHFQVQDDLISRHHCAIRFDGITYRIRDLGSRNGTFVNGHQIKGDVVLVPDDEIMIGTMMMQLSPVEQSGMETEIGENLNQTDIMDGTTISNAPPPILLDDDETNEIIILPDQTGELNGDSERKSG
ncbi:MAG: FHA domain-containing protein [Planctomycetaceae bacterium]|nr:FHA domain-containing protein [Planctomycetaceae bacterium]